MSRNQILIAGLAVLTGALLAVALLLDPYEPTRSDSLAGDYWLPELRERVGEVSRVELIGSGHETRLERSPEKGWQVLVGDGFSANFSVLQRFISSLSEARIEAKMTSNPELYERVGLAAPEDYRAESDADADADEDAASAEDDEEDPQPPGVMVRLLSGKSPIAEFSLGDKAANRRAQYGLRAGQAQVELLDQDFGIVAARSRWIDKEVFQLDHERVRRVLFQGDFGELSMQRKSSTDSYSVDLPGKLELRYEGMLNARVFAVRDLRVNDVFPADSDEAVQWFENPVANTRYECFNGLVVDVELAQTEDEKKLLRLSFRGDGKQVENSARPPGMPKSDPKVEAEGLANTHNPWVYEVESHVYNQLVLDPEEIFKQEGEDEEGS